MVQSSFKKALSLCLLSLFCLFFLGDFKNLAYGQVLGLPIIMLIFFLAAISFMFALVSIGQISGFWSAVGRGIVLFLSFGVVVFSGFIWLFDNIMSLIN